MASNYELWMDTLDFSCIPGFPHKYDIQDGGNALFPLFQQYKYHVATHVQKFMQFIWASNIVHEDIRMRLFLLSLHIEGNLSVRNWYEGFPCIIFLLSGNSLMLSVWIGITVSKNKKERPWSTKYGKKPWEKYRLKAMQEKEPQMIFHSSLKILIMRLLQKWKLVLLLLIYQHSQDNQMSYPRYFGMPSRVTMIIPHITLNGLWLLLQNMVLKKQKMFTCDHLSFT